MLIVGSYLSQDYGISADEKFHRNNGLFYYNYLKSLFIYFDIHAFDEAKNLIKENINVGEHISSVPSIQPVIFDLIAEFFIDLFNIQESKNIFQFRHFLNFVFYFCGLCFFYKLVFLRFKSSYYSLLGVLFLFLSPRFFAESFYNQKDIFFLSLICVNLYLSISFLKNPNFKNTLYLSIISALCIDTRIMGLIPFLIVLFFFFLRSINSFTFIRENLKFILFFPLATFFFIILLWPYLWDDPIKNLLFVFSELTSIDGDAYTLYFGNLFHFQNVPWHYYPVWIAISSPIITIFFFMIGFFILIKVIFLRFLELNNNSNEFWKNENELFDLYMLLMFFLPIFIVSIKGIGYDGWRQLYFIYPSIILISLLGFYKINYSFKKKIFKNISYLIVFLSLLHLVTWNYRFHPHQYAYSNLLIKGRFFNNFDIDYWGLSNTTSLNYIIRNNSNYPILVATKSFASLETSSLMLDNNDKNKVIITHKINEADFLITNYRINRNSNFVIDSSNYKKYYEILVDGIPINTIYKKNI